MQHGASTVCFLSERESCFITVKNKGHTSNALRWNYRNIFLGTNPLQRSFKLAKCWQKRSKCQTNTSLNLFSPYMWHLGWIVSPLLFWTRDSWMTWSMWGSVSFWFHFPWDEMRTPPTKTHLFYNHRKTKTQPTISYLNYLIKGV